MSTTNLLPAIGPDGKPLPKSKVKTSKNKTNKKGATSPSEEVTNVEVPAVESSARSASGIPIGTGVKTGEAFPKAQYSVVSPYQTYATLSNPQRANLLLQMGSIPGLYAKGDAPTSQYVAKQGNAVTFRKQDYDALLKLMAHSDSAGTNSYNESIVTFYKNPGLAEQYFGKVTPKTKPITLSSPLELELDITNKFLDLFDAPADKKTAKAYSDEIIKAQKAAGGANKLGAFQAESIFQKYVTKKANALVTSALESPEPDAKPINQGAFGITVTQIRNAYADNHLPLDDKKVYKDALAAARSAQAKQNVMQNIQMKAAQYYPAIADGIKNGQTVADLLDAPITSYANVFGVKASQVPQSFLSKVAGGTSILNQDDVQRVIWNSDGIEKAPGYRAQQLNDFKTMMDTFGIGPT